MSYSKREIRESLTKFRALMADEHARPYAIFVVNFVWFWNQAEDARDKDAAEQAAIKHVDPKWRQVQRAQKLGFEVLAMLGADDEGEIYPNRNPPRIIVPIHPPETHRKRTARILRRLLDGIVGGLADRMTYDQTSNN